MTTTQELIAHAIKRTIIDEVKKLSYVEISVANSKTKKVNLGVTHIDLKDIEEAILNTDIERFIDA
jgi:ribosomal protein S25